jgi:uncharacterized membrane protein
MARRQASTSRNSADRYGAALLVGAFLVILLLKMLLDVVEFVLTAVLATVILIFHHPALGIAFAFASKASSACQADTTDC